jgi:hypothetical protein
LIAISCQTIVKATIHPNIRCQGQLRTGLSPFQRLRRYQAHDVFGHPLKESLRMFCYAQIPGGTHECGFQDRCLKPLGHPSPFRMAADADYLANRNQFARLEISAVAHHQRD